MRDEQSMDFRFMQLDIKVIMLDMLLEKSW